MYWSSITMGIHGHIAAIQTKEEKKERNKSENQSRDSNYKKTGTNWKSKIKNKNRKNIKPISKTENRTLLPKIEKRKPNRKPKKTKTKQK